MSGNSLKNGRNSITNGIDSEYPTQINESLRQDYIAEEEFEEVMIDSIPFFTATCDIIAKSIPSTLGLAFESLIIVINLIFIGHAEDPIALAAVGLGNMMVIMTCFSVGIGLNGAIDTLVSQAYGNKQYYL